MLNNKFSRRREQLIIFYMDNPDTDDIYENIIDNDKLNILNNEDIIENDHIEKYLFSEYDDIREIIKIRQIYSKLIDDKKIFNIINE